MPGSSFLQSDREFSSVFLEQGNRVRNDAAIDIELVGFPPMMDPRKIDSVLHVHAETNDGEHHLQDGRSALGAAGSARDEKRACALSGQSWELLKEGIQRPYHLE